MSEVSDPNLATSATLLKAYVDYLVKSRMTAYDQQTLESDISIMTDTSVKKFYIDECDIEAQKEIDSGMASITTELEATVRTKVDTLLDTPGEISSYTTWIASQLPTLSTVISGVAGIKPDISGIVKDECYAILPDISDGTSARQKATLAALVVPPAPEVVADPNVPVSDTIPTTAL